MMKIGFFTSKFPNLSNNIVENCQFGGSVIATYNLVKELRSIGLDLEIFTTSPNNLDSVESQKNLKIFRYGTTFNFLSSAISLKLFYKPNSMIDIVHVSFDIPPSPFAGLVYSKRKNVPLVLTYHGDWDQSYGSFLRRLGISSCNRLFVNSLLSLATVIISPSEVYIQKSKFLKKYEEKIVTIPNGVHFAEFNDSCLKSECREQLKIPSDYHVILFIGNLSPYKGPDVLLKAFSKVLINFPRSILIFSGEGILRSYLEELSRSSGIQDKVRFLGFIPEKQKLQYLKSADVFCLPSVGPTESFGIVNLEAMASGIPVIASRIGGIPDVIRDGKNGILVTPNDHSELAKAIMYLFENEKIRDAMGKYGKELSREYSWEKNARKTLDVYNTVLS